MLYYLGNKVNLCKKQSGAVGASETFERGILEMSHKYVYLFTEGNGKMRELLGGKGANLAEMTNIGLPVPQGFTITTEACTQYYEDGRQINAEIQAEIMEYVEKLEAITGKKFGDKENPLLVSVRSGARASMPGMMDTILNFGVDLAAILIVLSAGLGGNSEALGNGQADIGHLGQVCALAAKQLTHLCVAFGKQINILLAH